MKPLTLEAEPISAFVSGPLRKRSLEVHLSAEIAAARRCLFYALTLPEYMEAWLQMPDTTAVHATFLDCPDELRLDRYRFLRRVGSIFVRFQTTSEDSMRLVWRDFIDDDTSSTSVHITLRGNQRHCTVEVTHSGFRDQQERLWYDAMWTRSLADLSRLMSR